MKIKDLALLIEGTLEGDGDINITGLSGAESANLGDLTFAVDEDRLALAEQSKSSGILTTKTIRSSIKPLIRVNNPKLSFLIAYNLLNKGTSKETFIDPLASIASSVRLGKNVWIGSHVTIGENVVVGDNARIESGCVIKNNCSIGNFCHLHPNCVLYERTILKNNVVLHSGVVAGSDGFGYMRDNGNIYKFPQLGKVTIEDDVEIGANTTIDRGSLGDTVIGSGSKIDNLCQISHNVKIGKNVIMAAQSGVAGSTVVEDNVTMAGHVAITDNVTIGKNVTIGGRSTVIGHIKENSVVWGMPARPIKDAKKQMAVLSWMTKNFSGLSKMIKNKNGAVILLTFFSLKP